MCVPLLVQHFLQHATVLAKGWTQGPPAATATDDGRMANLPRQPLNLVQSQKPFGAGILSSQLLAEGFKAWKAKVACISHTCLYIERAQTAQERSTEHLCHPRHEGGLPCVREVSDALRPS